MKIKVLLLYFIAACAGFPQSSADRLTEEMIKKLSSTQVDENALSEILRQPTSPDVTIALKRAFDRQQDARAKQHIAATLAEMGEPDSRFYDYLVAKAQEAMASTAPSSVSYDLSGNNIRGEFSVEFRAWCSVNLVDLRDGLARQLREGEDIRILASTRDPRATELLVAALRSQNEFVTIAAAQALGLMRVNSAVAAIVTAAQRLPPASAWVIAQELALYGTPEADRELERLVKDPARIVSFKKMAVATRDFYDRTDRARLGLSSPGNLKPTTN